MSERFSLGMCNGLTATIPSVCVVIPTRERADTLVATLQSCVTQRYERMIILVCDNNSQDNTKEVVESFKDKRIKYINPGKRLSMADNWEFAIGHVDEDYVTIIGDDDALLPSAIADMTSVTDKFNAKIVTWKKAEYCWPNHLHIEKANCLYIPLNNRILKISGKTAIAKIFALKMPYSWGPCIYNSLVSIKYVKDVIRRDGKLFQAMSPDIYSSLALASVVDEYYFSTRPFSVNGASAHSNGTAAMSATTTSSVYDLFLSEYSVKAKGFGQIRGSMTAGILESLLAFFEKAKAPSYQIDFKKVFRRIIHELSQRPTFLDLNKELLLELSKQHNVGRFVDGLMKSVVKRKILVQQASGQGSRWEAFNGDSICLKADAFDAHNVNQAAQVVANILGAYVIPLSIQSYNYIKYIYTRIIQRTRNFSAYLGV